MNNEQIKKLKVFKTVSNAIGDERAIIELSKVIDSAYCRFEDDNKLDSAFVWLNSPQGHDFWSNIFNPFDK